MGLSNYPEGVTTADIDRHFGGCDEKCGICENRSCHCHPEALIECRRCAGFFPPDELTVEQVCEECDDEI